MRAIDAKKIRWRRFGRDPGRRYAVEAEIADGQYGKVFGFVTTGFSIGGIIAPMIFGFILDKYQPELVFYAIAGFMFLSMFTVFTSVRWRGLRSA